MRRRCTKCGSLTKNWEVVSGVVQCWDCGKIWRSMSDLESINAAADLATYAVQAAEAARKESSYRFCTCDIPYEDWMGPCPIHGMTYGAGVEPPTQPPARKRFKRI